MSPTSKGDDFFFRVVDSFAVDDREEGFLAVAVFDDDGLLELEVDFLAVDFLAVGFLAVDFLAVDFLVAVFLAPDDRDEVFRVEDFDEDDFDDEPVFFAGIPLRRDGDGAIVPRGMWSPGCRLPAASKNTPDGRADTAGHSCWRLETGDWRLLQSSSNSQVRVVSRRRSK